jgi:DMSO/TMAO reductase YedYZ molybdopterin-dependent catalytic subunit
MAEIDGARPIGRRLFLGLSALGAGTLLFGQSVVGGEDEAGLLSQIIGQGGFRIYTVAPIPKFDPASWRLEVGGLVANRLSLTFDELQALRRSVHEGAFHCVTGWSVSNLTWEGVSLKTILEQVSPGKDAGGMVFSSSDGAYTDALTMDQALAPDVMLADTLNGKPLPLNQGMPLRLIVPQMYGYKSVKWVNKIDFVPKAGPGYWEVRGYDIDAYLDKRNGPPL